MVTQRPSPVSVCSTSFSRDDNRTSAGSCAFFLAATGAASTPIYLLADERCMSFANTPDTPINVPGFTDHRHDRLTDQDGGVCFFCEIVDCRLPLLEFSHNRRCLHYCLGQKTSSLIAGLCVQTPQRPGLLLVFSP